MAHSEDNTHKILDHLFAFGGPDGVLTATGVVSKLDVLVLALVANVENEHSKNKTAKFLLDSFISKDERYRDVFLGRIALLSAKETLLHLASAGRDADILREIPAIIRESEHTSSLSARLNSLNSNGSTPLAMAVRTNRIANVKELLAHDADPYFRHKGTTLGVECAIPGMDYDESKDPLMQYSGKGKKIVARCIVEVLRDSQDSWEESRFTDDPSAFEMRIAFSMLPIEAGANVNQPSPEGTLDFPEKGLSSVGLLEKALSGTHDLEVAMQRQKGRESLIKLILDEAFSIERDVSTGQKTVKCHFENTSSWLKETNKDEEPKAYLDRWERQLPIRPYESNESLSDHESNSDQGDMSDVENSSEYEDMSNDEDILTYSRDETITAVSKYYEFRRTMYLKDSDVIYPPADGWPSITEANPDTLASFEKSDEVLALLAHLPYVGSNGGGDNTNVIPATPSQIGNTSSVVETPMILLDTKRGTTVQWEGFTCPCSIEHEHFGESVSFKPDSDDDMPEEEVAFREGGRTRSP
ncbi:hypothetical protein B0H66DRAFT_616729 [Apodospora peruviana]|uniref:Ankyrin repeat protein n=1 Tax=Apodospora peruviana TaxID=516989 RepID=A0AAE0IIZ1_9PEZI|nr:hypothetical protein B0H66DRAFT_616729 [Apodospora peruviana]